MSRSVTLVDYGIGNLLSVSRALEKCGGTVRLATNAYDVVNAERLVLPGVGAFGDCASELRRRGLFEALQDFAARGRPLLGVCVGMQLLLTSSEEFGDHTGLGLLPGHVSAIPRLDRSGAPRKVPHIGWASLHPPRNEVQQGWSRTVLRCVDVGASAYFVHSFRAIPSDPKHRLAECYYHEDEIVAVLQKDNIVGTQFHPEKSGPVGLSILNEFLYGG